jgi:hypothetical protein
MSAFRVPRVWPLNRWTIAVVLSCVVFSACTSARSSSSTVTTPPGGVIGAVSTTLRPEIDPYNWTLDEIVDGGNLRWKQAFDADLVPLRFVFVNDTLFFAATSQRDGGLWVWSTADGLTWRDHGEVVPAGERIGAVGSNGSELLVVTLARSGLEPQVLGSPDGVTWAHDEVPLDSVNPLLAFRANVIGGTPDLIVLAGSSVLDPREFIVDGFGDSFPSDVESDLLAVTWEQSGEDLLFHVTVPPGFAVGDASAVELGLTAQEKSWFRNDGIPSGLSLWSQPTGGGWQFGLLRDESNATSIFNSADGEVLLTTGSVAQPYGASAAVYRSIEGLSWDRLASIERPLTASVWGDIRIGPSATGGDSDVLVSGDGLDWSRTNLSGRFPVAPVFTITHAAAGGTGYVATVESFDWTYRDEPPDTIASSALEKDGLTVRIGDMTFGPSGLIDGPHQVAVYETGVAEPHLYPIDGPTERDDVAIDMAAQTITFRDQDDSDLVTVTFQEMDDLLYRTLAPARQFTQAHSQVLAHATDNSGWMLWNLSKQVGDNSIADIGLAGDQALLAIQNRNGGLEVWATPLP